MASEKRPKQLESRSRAVPVEGKVLWPDFTKPLAVAGGGFALLSAAASLLGGLLTWSEGSPIYDLFLARLIAWAVIGLVIVAAGVAAFLYLLFRFRRFIIADDRLQLVGSFGRVLGQVPYENIRAIDLETIYRDNSDMVISLHTRRRKDTWWPRMTDGREEYDILVTGGLEIDGTRLRMELDRAVLRHRERHGAPRWMR